MGSIAKYVNRLSSEPASDGLHWGRAADDGAPFRGRPPMLKNAEYDQRVERVSDAKLEMFDLRNESQRAAYQTVLDRAAAGWYQILTRDHKWAEENGSPYVLVYVEWLEYYYEDSGGAPGRA